MILLQLEKEYNELLSSGMFWVIFPQLTGIWEEDKEQFIKYKKSYSMGDGITHGTYPKTEEDRIRRNMKKGGEQGNEYNSGVKSVESESAVEYCERMYPQMTKEFKKIQEDQYEMFCKKQRNYGPDNISVGSSLQTSESVKVSLTGIWFRVNDKIQRLKQLVVLGQPDEVGESIQDSFDDMSIYGIIAQIVSNGKWGK